MIQFTNTLTRAKQEFIPMEPGKVKMYCCGPTVYNFAHIGNLRTYIFEDTVRRMLEMNGFEVTHVMNITDVGHLESDADEGEDKMEKGAQREGISPWEIARKYEETFFNDLERLNIKRPTRTPRATEHVVQMIELIKKLEERGYTYTRPSGVYFDTSKFATYTELARLDLAGLQAGGGGRVDHNPDKRHPNDFALWVLNKPRHAMQWESPWGRGYPGWHIECSAMSMQYLGATFDIHCGGVDHIPVHNTNEIAQSEAATGCQFVRYWLHGEFLQMGESKMAKSADNFITLQTLVDEGYDPLAYRYLCLQAHYRSELKFSFESLDAATVGLRKVYATKAENDPLSSEQAFHDASEEVLAAINEDLGIPQAVGLLNRYSSYRLWTYFDAVMGLRFEERTQKAPETLPEDVAELARQRDAARKEKNWLLSDSIRQQLIELGYEVGDSPAGTTVKKRSL